MPRTPANLKGRIYDVDGSIISGATVILTHSSGTISKVSNSEGDYILNYGDLSSWIPGDSATITVTVSGKGTISETISMESGGTVFNLTLAETSDLTYTETLQNVHNLVFTLPVGFDGTKISNTNPLPVKVIDSSGANVNNSFKIARVYNASNQVLYFGRAVPGTDKSEAKWQIVKYTYSDNRPADTLFAGGSYAFDKVWDNRTSYSYS